jgi:hypothetical protein
LAQVDPQDRPEPRLESTPVFANARFDLLRINVAFPADTPGPCSGLQDLAKSPENVIPISGQPVHAFDETFPSRHRSEQYFT